MNVTCPSCSAEFDVDSSRVPASGLSMRCPECSHTFRVQAGDDQAAAPALADGGAPADSERYFVKRPTGKVFGPFDANAIEMMLEAGKLSKEAQVSTDRENWQHLSRVPALANFVDVPDDAGDSAPVGSTRLGGFASSVAEDDEMDKTEVRSPELPTPASGDDSDSSGPSLPRPKSSGGKKDSPRLPKAKKGPSLPKPSLPTPKSKKSSAEGDGPSLPRSKGSDEALPTSKESVDLPRSKSSEAELPASSEGGNLPRPKNSGQLPKPKGGDSLPQSKGGDSLPRS
ncbi:MAG: zinc-ribbon domain-containing protein, partial [Persicimonas sp.]